MSLSYYPSKAINLLRYAKAVKRREVLVAAVYITDKCNSKCRICGMWRKENPQDMPLEVFHKLLDGIDKKTHLAILGGEFLLHPNIEDILSALEKKGCPYNIESNGILAEKLLELTLKYRIPEVQISCDGVGETYKRIRGVDNYENIVWLMKKLAPITQLRVNYVVCPWNTREELLTVKGLCDRFKVQLAVEVYSEFEYLETGKAKMDGIYRSDDVQSFPRSLLLRLYERWANGELRLPCRSINWTCQVVPDGTVFLCTHKMVALGNVKEQSLREIWKSEKTAKLHSEYNKCNDCWSGCYRNVDVALLALRKPSLLWRSDGKLPNKSD